MGGGGEFAVGVAQLLVGGAQPGEDVDGWLWWQRSRCPLPGVDRTSWQFGQSAVVP